MLLLPSLQQRKYRSIILLWGHVRLTLIFQSRHPGSADYVINKIIRLPLIQIDSKFGSQQIALHCYETIRQR